MTKNKNITFTIINTITIIILPLMIVLSVLYILLTSPSFYSTILKRTDLVGTFIEAKNLEITQSIQNEIDNKVGLASYVLTYQAIKNQYEEAKKAYDNINKTSEYENLKQQYDEVKKVSYKDVKAIYKDEETFKNNKEAELQKIKNQIALIEQYREEHKNDIEAAKLKFEDIEDKYEDAYEEYNKKQEEANEIIQKHRNTFVAQLNDDLDLLKPAITEIINDKLIDGNIVPLIKKYINFFTSYESIKSEYILELTDTSNPIYPKKVTQILLPDITISLWTNTNGTKKHLLSDILVDEIKRIPDIKNRAFLIAVFTFADTAIGEFIGSNYLKKAGLWFSNGTIYKHNIVLSGNSADLTITIIKILSYGKYVVYATAILLVLYVIFIIFASVDIRIKLIWIKRILLFPSIIILGIGAIALASPIILIQPSDILSLASAKILRQLACNTAMCVCIPIMSIFFISLLGGLIIRKIHLSWK